MDSDDLFEILAMLFLNWPALVFIIVVLTILSLIGVIDWGWAT